MRAKQAFLTACLLALMTPVESLQADDVAALLKAKAQEWRAIETGALSDSIHHGLMKYKREAAPHKRYQPELNVHIARNWPVWTKADSGWPPNK